MSFVERDDVMALAEDLFTRLVESLLPGKRLLAKPWPRFKYAEAMDRFGIDKPDIRFGLELKDITDLAAGSGFKVFESAAASGETVRGINAKGCAGYSRKEIDDLTALAGEFGARGLAYDAVLEGEGRSSFAKFLSPEKRQAIRRRLEAEPGDLLLFVADRAPIALESLARLRNHLGDRLGLRDPQVLAFCWVIDFPFVNWNEEEKRWDPSHHLFTSPMRDDIPLLESDPGRALGQQYDMVLNGVEAGGGSIRIHERGLQEKVFQLIGLQPEVASQRFGLSRGVRIQHAPHGGSTGFAALRLFADEPDIREVIAFPKNQAARDVMAGAPSPVDSEQLRELSLRLATRP
jgi:aspartyl-tRNA synthetase